MYKLWWNIFSWLLWKCGHVKHTTCRYPNSFCWYWNLLGGDLKIVFSNSLYAIQLVVIADFDRLPYILTMMSFFRVKILSIYIFLHLFYLNRYRHIENKIIINDDGTYSMVWPITFLCMYFFLNGILYLFLERILTPFFKTWFFFFRCSFLKSWTWRKGKKNVLEVPSG